MDDAVLIDDGVAVGRKSATQRDIRIEHTVLIEVDSLQCVRGLDLACIRRQFSREQVQQ